MSLDHRAMGLALACALAGCGRLGFDPTTVAISDAATSDGAGDAPSTGPTGPRWLSHIATAGTVLVTGAAGEVVAATAFTGSLAGDGFAVTGMAPFGSVAAVRYDAQGNVASTAVLDSTSRCDLRGLGIRGNDAIVLGYAQGGTTTPALGPCAVASGHQDPVAIGVDRQGNQYLVAHWVAAGANAQAFDVAAFADGTVAIAGVYSSGLTIGGALPTAGFDPNAYLARTADAAATPSWATAITAPATLYPGPLAASGDELCALGSFSGSATILGHPLTSLGGIDGWVARIDGTGAARFVRQLGSTSDDTASGNGGMVADGGGCAAGLTLAADATVDGVVLPVSQGPGAVVWFDATGAATAGIRLPASPLLASAGGRIYAAMTVTAPLAIGPDVYTPAGSDVIVVEVDRSGLRRLVGAVTGTGDQVLSTGFPSGFAAIAPDAVAISVRSTGQLVFGGSTSDSGATMVDVVVALGV